MINEDRVKREFFCLGASAGGIEAVIGIISRLPAGLPATLAVVIHRSPDPRSGLAGILGRRSALPVIEPRPGDPVERGKIYLAPQDLHLTIEGDTWALSDTPRVHRTRPAVDPLFLSAAKGWGPRVVGVLLSGGGMDGVEGLIAIKQHGGLSIAQEPAEAAQRSMPQSAIRYDDVDLVLRVERIAEVIPALAAGAPIDGDDGIAVAGDGRH
jgi:two-component system chemotaxis response regulator CheB